MSVRNFTITSKMATSRDNFTLDEVIGIIQDTGSRGSELGCSDLESDYIPSENEASEEPESVEAESGTANNESQPEATDQNGTPTKPHKRRAPQKWKRQVIKEKRLKGDIYKNSKGQERQAKAMGPPCRSGYCRKSNLRSCQSLSEEQRKEIFERFWTIKSWEERRSTVHALVDKVDIKQKKCEAASRRNASLSYHLKLSDATKVPVCKSLFTSTLALSKRTVGSWVKDINNNYLPQPRINKTGKHVPVAEADCTFLKSWLSGLPTVPSHYYRKVPAYKDKKFLYPGTSKSKLYREYQESAGEAGGRVVGETFFNKVFDEEKFSVFTPRKEQCDVCISAKHGNIDQDNLNAQVKAKDEARAEKSILKKELLIKKKRISFGCKSERHGSILFLYYVSQPFLKNEK